MTETTEKLKSKGLKVTPQRLAIYNYLLSTTAHPTADTIYNALSSDYPTMSPATVYKTLKMLCDVDLIMELNVGEDSYRYDASTAFHAHLVCEKCNNVYDYYYADELSSLKTTISKKLDFSISSEKLYFYGVCKNCK